jgi:glycosyl hydrolase family 113
MKKILSTILFITFVGFSQAGAGVFQYRSINFCSWGPGGFDSEKVDEALLGLKSLGANVVTLDWAVPFDPNTGARAHQFDPVVCEIREPSIQSIINVANKVTALGMDVAFKPHIGHVQQAENLNQFNTGPAFVTSGHFFPQWKAYLIQIAQLAQQFGSPFILIGTEMGHTIQYRDQWVDIINTLRTVYSGQISYDALLTVWNPNALFDVSFHDHLDFMSVSMYADFADSTEPTYEELVSSWNDPNHCEQYATGISCYTSWGIVDHFYRFYMETGKKIFFGETGFPSHDGSAMNQVRYDLIRNGVQDWEEQRLATHAMFDVWDDHTEWMLGMSLWSIDPNVWWDKDQPWYANGYEPMGKPVEHVIRHWFKVVPIQDFINKYYVEAYGTPADPAGLNNWTHALWSGSASGLDLIMALFGSPERAQTGAYYLICDDYGIRAN